ncbi:MAG: spondin domain-containing protein [Planctomycetota bacterium]
MNRRARTTESGYWTLVFVVLAFLMGGAPLHAQDQQVLVTIESLVPENGVYFTPVWVGFHEGSFDLFDVGSLASEAVERIAEDGNVSVLQADFAAATGQTGGVDGVISSPAGFQGAPVFDPGETSSTEFALTPAYHRYMSFASMVVPSNDAFIGNHNPRAIELFDAAGTFRGKQIVTILGSMVWDAGTELNTEMDAAFINQTAPDTGVTTMSPALPHPGYLGSYGNPGSAPIILGGTNAAGNPTDLAGGDFTLPYAVVARITIEPAPAGQGMANSAISLFSNGRGGEGQPVIYVTSQELYYDSIVTADPLPPKGPFQRLFPTPDGLQTEFGPGDKGYVGGRWWVDVNGNGEQDEDDHYFMCPLLPPGRETLEP